MRKSLPERVPCLCGCGQIPRLAQSRWVWGHCSRDGKTRAWNHSPEHLAKFHSPEARAKARLANCGKERIGTGKATVSPTTRDLEWAAGFLEGEGCFSKSHASAIQVNPEPIGRLMKLFGGSVLIRWRGKDTRGYKRQEARVWSTSGARARGVMMTLYSLLTEKRKGQIREALGVV